VRGQHFFFATPGDLAPGFESLESQWLLGYCLRETRTDEGFPVHHSLPAVPFFGLSLTGDTAGDRDYLVFPRDKRLRVRSIPLQDGGVHYVLEPSPETVHFRSGGPHEASGALIAGRVARSAVASVAGDNLYKSFSQTVLRGFNKVHSFWVGPEAYAQYKGGRRLVTMGIDNPREYDLAEEVPLQRRPTKK
jgi:hypothetical protein